MKDKKYILVIEDDQAYGRVFTRKLTHEGYEVKWAKDGEEGLKMIDEKKPDLAIVDLMMPKIDGFGVLKGIQDRGFQDDFKVVIATNLSQNIDREKADKLGADDYFVKSNLSIKKMVDKVRENLSKN